MPPVTLHQPAEGLNRGDTYTGPREAWLVQNGYAAAQDDSFDGLHAAGANADEDPTLSTNREKADEDVPLREGVEIVDDGRGGRARTMLPDVDVNADPEGLKGAEQKLEGVEAKERDALSPDVQLGAFYAAVDHDRKTAAEGDPEVQARQEAAQPAVEDDVEAQRTARSEDRIQAAQAAREADKEAQRGAYNPAADKPAKSEDREDGTNAETRILTAEEASREERKGSSDEEPKKATRRARKEKDSDEE